MNEKTAKDLKNTELREFGHDVLNSLTRIIGQLEVCLKSTDLEQMKTKLAVTLNSANECANFCRENMNATGHVKEKLLLGPFFQDLQEIYRRNFPDFQLETQIIGAPSVQIETNRTLLKNAIQNLTKNSMEAGAQKMMIVVDNTRICFIDNGPGISPEKAQKIREKGTTKEDAKGHGLGLLSLSRFCKSNGWKLFFHNNESTEYFPTGFTVEFILI